MRDPSLKVTPVLFAVAVLAVMILAFVLLAVVHLPAVHRPVVVLTAIGPLAVCLQLCWPSSRHD